MSLCAIGNRGLNQGWGWNEQQQEMESPRGNQYTWGGLEARGGLAFSLLYRGLGVLVLVPGSTLTLPGKAGCVWVALHKYFDFMILELQ